MAKTKTQKAESNALEITGIGPIRGRWASRCYEYAAKTLLQRGDKARLCHGQAAGLPHAWVEVDGLAEDAGSVAPAEEYRAFFSMADVKTYSRAEACALILSEKIWGPWE